MNTESIPSNREVSEPSKPTVIFSLPAKFYEYIKNLFQQFIDWLSSILSAVYSGGYKNRSSSQKSADEYLSDGSPKDDKLGEKIMSNVSQKMCDVVDEDASTSTERYSFMKTTAWEKIETEFRSSIEKFHKVHKQIECCNDLIRAYTHSEEGFLLTTAQSTLDLAVKRSEENNDELLRILKTVKDMHGKQGLKCLQSIMQKDGYEAHIPLIFNNIKDDINP